MTIQRGIASLVLVLVCIAPVTLMADDEDPTTEMAEKIRSHYTKFEHRIHMRDGVRLFTVVYVPNEPTGTFPILLMRTPYSVGPYGADRYARMIAPAAEMVDEGFIFAFQDVRGTYMSEGEFVNMRPQHTGTPGPGDVDESTDTYDTIDWLVKHVQRNNGRVGMWGLSYPGFYAAAGMIDSHPALKAVSPQAPIADWFWDDMHHHGAFTLLLSFNFFSSFGRARPEPTTERGERFDHGTPDGYAFFLDMGPLKNANDDYLHGEIEFWNQICQHPDYDQFWQSRNLLPHLDGVGAAVMVVGGWFDAEDLYGPLHIYREVERRNPDTFNILVMGPWRHGGWIRSDGSTLGEADFGFKTAEWYSRHALLPFFRHFLKDEGEPPAAEAIVFETGANRWRTFPSWPPPGLRRAALHLGGSGRLAWSEPEDGGESFDEYVSDPAKPVPYTATITNRWHAEYMTEDQRFAARRPDVLVFRSEPLADDLTLAGPLQAHLWVSTTAGDADWVVKVIDEFPPRLPGHDPDSDEPDLGATQRLVRAEIFRGRYRSSYEQPEPFVAGQPTEVSFELQDVLHTFKRGHRVMVQVQSTLFPLFDRNPQRWVPNIFEAGEEDFVTATHRVYHSPQLPSRIEVGILE